MTCNMQNLIKENLISLGADLVGFSKLESSPIVSQPNLKYEKTDLRLIFHHFPIPNFP